MSRAQYEGAMDGPSGIAGSVRRARERAEAGLPPEFPPNSSLPFPRRAPQPPVNGISGMTISRPQPVAPQWPLAGPIPSPTSSEDSDRYRPPPGRSPQAPQRPPRPSRVPSILDSSRVQEHTPVFQYVPQNQRVSELSVAETTASSRQSTLSSVGSIPDFPLPTSAPSAANVPNVPNVQNMPPPPPPPPPPMPRRSVTLGPPPSSRRGLSSFYSTTSYVSPIPEESPRTRSHTSYASSAAIPESYGTISPALSPDGAYFDDAIEEESVYSGDDADADERGLVRSASIGRKGKPSIVTTRSAESRDAMPIVLPLPSRPKPKPFEPQSQPQSQSPFDEGTGYLEASSSSGGPSGAPSTAAATTGTGPRPESMLGAAEAAKAADPSAFRDSYMAVSPRPSRFSAIRRPPRLDMVSVRDAEARGSLTSLPDLIRRATRLASMIDKGRRPASQFNALDFPPDVYPREFNNRDADKELSIYNEKHQSGLSDMLAAFPPPVQARNLQPPPPPPPPPQTQTQQARFSGTSWPLPLGRVSFRGPPQTVADPPRDAESPATGQEKPGRRCCGLPMWGFIVLLFILIVVIAAAIIVPLEFFVIRKQDTRGAQPAMETCQNQLVCENGGTNVINQGMCACICSNGFTGPTCTVPGADGCTTTMLSPNDPVLRNVTLGQAIPRLIQAANTNFSIPLSATTILAKFNSANLSCIAENALVTFDGSAVRMKGALDQVMDNSGANPVRLGAVAANGFPIVISVSPGVDVTVTLNNPGNPSITTITNPTSLPSDASTVFATTLTVPDSAPPSTPSPSPTTTPLQTTRTATTTSAPPTTTPTAPRFIVTEQVLDFARVGVLFVLQSQTLNDAVQAQMALQKFFSDASPSNSGRGVTPDKANNLNIGGKNTIDLVHLLINLDS